MGGLFAKIGDVLGSPLKDLVLGVLDRVKASPQVKQEIQKQMEQNDFELQKMQLEIQARTQEAISREIEIASANIRAEAASGDKFTSRARPSFIYVMLVIFICNYIVFPIARVQAILFPDPLFWLFGSCMLGYTGARTWEKLAGNGNGKDIKK
jgi:hypothetical protein